MNKKLLFYLIKVRINGFFISLWRTLVWPFKKRDKSLKKLDIKGFHILFSEVSPADFLDEAGGLPVSMFKEKKVQTMYQQAMDALKTDTEKKRDTEKELKFCKKIVKNIHSINKLAFDISMYNDKEIIVLANLIIINSLKVFPHVMELDTNQCYLLDEMGKRYGKTPIECLYTRGSYTDLDAYMFNRHVIYKALEKEHREARKKAVEARKNRLRRK